ncbi:hypothetical protein Plim_3224 [Planctopirus limnophila DSM 3776]|uniref:Uncharacterized protein n=1 Tax=Planctopirus limnophila (strain ATCC 43296 / DSM 3776 / IFAM 1008 / Mu 290) TaxID=521674 RepID=D5STK9_PLAL2|nr:hypothetical protein Plim_3224 [Planctopirus limnophila DSM 3776]
MFGISYRCDSCDFTFCSGWSHHSAGQHVVCSNCAAHFILGEGQSEWGAKIGEQLQLLTVDGEHDVPTGVFITVLERNSENAHLPEKYGVSRLAFDPVSCPHCESLGSLRQWFDENASCPKCYSGTIHRHGSCIY